MHSLMFTPTSSDVEEELFTTGRKSDQIKEIIKAWYQLGIKSESLLDRGVHLQGWLDSGVLWVCQL